MQLGISKYTSIEPTPRSFVCMSDLELILTGQDRCLGYPMAEKVTLASINALSTSFAIQTAVLKAYLMNFFTDFISLEVL